VETLETVPIIEF